MTARRDDDALSWGGDDDPTLDVGVETARTPRVEPAKDAAPAATRKPEHRGAAHRDDERRIGQPGLGNVALVSIGLIAGAYLFFAVGWLIVGLRLQALGGLPVSSVMLTASTLVATAAPVIWFGAAFVLTRHSRTWVRFAWLVAGVILLVPWPFIFTGGM